MGGYDGAIKNYPFEKHPAVLANNNLLANKSIYWPSPPLASESEQIDKSHLRSINNVLPQDPLFR
jgi:hypothetical protein